MIHGRVVYLFLGLFLFFTMAGSHVLATPLASAESVSTSLSTAVLAWQNTSSSSSYNRYNKYKYRRKSKSGSRYNRYKRRSKSRSYNRYKRRSTYKRTKRYKRKSTYNRSRYRNRYKRRSTYTRKKVYRRTYTRKRYVPRRRTNKYKYRRTVKRRYIRRPVRSKVYKTRVRKYPTRRRAWSNNRVRRWNPVTKRWEWKRKRTGLIGRPYRHQRRPITVRKRYRVYDSRTRRYKWVYKRPVVAVPARRAPGRWVRKRVRTYDYRTRNYKYVYKRVYVTGGYTRSRTYPTRTGTVFYRSPGSRTGPTTGSGSSSKKPKRTGRGQSVPHCLSVVRKGDRTYFKNRCGYEISVAYCSTNRKISGKHCGHNRKSWNPFYTHIMNLKPGRENYRWKVGNVRYGVCKGYINSWAAKGKFSSSSSGSYGCHNL